MRRVVLAMAVSVDGFVATEDGAIDWIFPHLDGEVERWIIDYVSRTDVQLIGRVNFLEQERYWPDAPDAQAPLLNRAEKVVFSSTLTEVGWANSRIARHDVRTEVDRLRTLPGRDILVPGGARFARHVAEQGLVDLYRLMVYPVALGAGIPLFASHVPLRLVDSHTFANGVVSLTYRPGD
ncbi:dihydrofolate reductase family protein [Actinomadura harenae]|uniref:Dihydrofolate reductase n=1 Tax=Actinomadura harenae TaxID=2483351 RepID=A0A3M2LTA6_9ACTN|nr:dihydrofolate reductase family protein [Actinomadura harenae]RMI40724.1 dihydrofolate reductase [Actinomadura harenae]